MSSNKIMKPENKRPRLEKIMEQICNDFGEFGVQEGESIGLGIHPLRIYFHFIEVAVEEGEGTQKLKGSKFSMKDAFEIAGAYKLVMDEKREPNYNGNNFRLAFDLKELENGEVYV